MFQSSMGCTGIQIFYSYILPSTFPLEPANHRDLPGFLTSSHFFRGSFSSTPARSSNSDGGANAQGIPWDLEELARCLSYQSACWNMSFRTTISTLGWFSSPMDCWGLGWIKSTSRIQPGLSNRLEETDLTSGDFQETGRFGPEGLHITCSKPL